MILQVLIAQSGQGLAVGRQDAADGHIAGLVELLDAGQQAGSLDLDGHVAVLQHTLDGDGVAVLLDVGSVGDLRQVQLLSDLGTDLSGIAVDGLTAAHHDIVLLNTQGAQSGGQNLGGSVGIGTAELTGGNQHALVSAHGHQLTQHTGSGRGAHGDNGDLAAGGVL